MGILCKKRSVHKMNDSDTYNWVQRRHDVKDTREQSRRDTLAYNTKSEWFDICFISSLFQAITSADNNLDGLRIYLGNGLKGQDGLAHDVFILVPTHTKGQKHRDDFSCLKLIPTSLCCPDCQPLYKRENWIKLVKWFNHKYFKSGHSFASGGYDNGELCPNNCNQ